MDQRKLIRLERRIWMTLIRFTWLKRSMEWRYSFMGDKSQDNAEKTDATATRIITKGNTMKKVRSKTFCITFWYGDWQAFYCKTWVELFGKGYFHDTISNKINKTMISALYVGTTLTMYTKAKSIHYQAFRHY